MQVFYRIVIYGMLLQTYTHTELLETFVGKLCVVFVYRFIGLKMDNYSLLNFCLNTCVLCVAHDRLFIFLSCDIRDT